MIKPYLKQIKPYTPGKPIEELRRELGIAGRIIKMASNENPLGVPQKALAAMKGALSGLHRYPDGAAYSLRQALAQKWGVAPEEIVLGNGSNEVIDLLVKACIQEGDEALMSNPSFLMYEKFVSAAGGKVRKVPLREMKHDLEGLAREITPQTKIIFLDHPHNPTGSILEHESFASWLKRLPAHLLVVLDEAYGEFVRTPLAVKALAFKDGEPPVVMLRTFSKAYGLAGLRVGYGIMRRDLADVLNTIRQPFNVNTLGQVAAQAALEDPNFLQQVQETTWQGADFLFQALKDLGLKPYPTQANFILVDLGRPARPVYEALLRKGVIVRSMEAYGFPQCLRVSIGLPEENQTFIQALQEVLREA